jgi:hypothetical protein
MKKLTLLKEINRFTNINLYVIKIITVININHSCLSASEY